MTEKERIVEALEDVAHKIRATSQMSAHDVVACQRAAALLRSEPVGEPVLERAMKLGWLAARNPFHERMEFGIWFAAVGAKRIAEGYFAPPAAPEAQEPERATPWLKASRWNALALMAAQLRCKDNPEDAAFGKRLLTMMAEVETLVPPVSAAGEEERDAK